MSNSIFWVCEALEQTRVRFNPLCLEERILVLQLQAFDKMGKYRESGICEVWCSKRNANRVKERLDSMFRTVTVLDLGLEFCQMLELDVDGCGTS